MTMTILNIIISIINSIIDIYLINLFIKTIYHIKDKEHHNKFIIFLEFILLVFSNYLKFKYLWIKIILLFLAVYFKNKKHMHRRDKSFLIVIIFTILRYPFEQICLFIFQFILDNQFSFFTNYWYLIGALLLQISIKSYEYIIMTFIGYFNNKFIIHNTYIRQTTILIILICSITFLFTLYPLYYFKNIGRTFLFFIFIYIITLILFIYLDYEHKNKVLEMEEINKNIISETNTIKEKLKADKEIRTIKHDLKNDYIILNGYISNNHYDMAKNFINDKMSIIIKLTKTTHSGNTAIDSIIEQKFTLMKKYGIEYHESISSMYIGDIVEYDIALLIGLALDNAIEAACQVNKQKTIYLHSKNSADCLIITISNSIVKGNQPCFNKTSKMINKKNHGLGINKMSEIVTRYHGAMTFKVIDDKVVLKLLLQTKNNKI